MLWQQETPSLATAPPGPSQAMAKDPATSVAQHADRLFVRLLTQIIQNEGTSQLSLRSPLAVSRSQYD